MLAAVELYFGDKSARAVTAHDRMRTGSELDRVFEAGQLAPLGSFAEVERHDHLLVATAAFKGEDVRIGEHRPPAAPAQRGRIASQASESLEMRQQVLVLLAAPQHRQPRLCILAHTIAALAQPDSRAVVDDGHAR